MRAAIPSRRSKLSESNLAISGRSTRTRTTIEPLITLAQSSDSLVSGSLGPAMVRGAPYWIPRFVFMGPKGGGDTVRLALFAGFNGDEEASLRAVLRFLGELEKEPELARGYHIYAYPICNPAGFDSGTKGNSAGQDLTRNFWNGSNQPEAYYLEREIGVLGFHGVISVQTGADAAPQYFISADRLSVLSKALDSTAMPRSRMFPAASPDGAAANAGFLTRTDELKAIPFEIDLRIVASEEGSDHAVEALTSILNSYARLIAIQQNL